MLGFLQTIGKTQEQCQIVAAFGHQVMVVAEELNPNLQRAPKQRLGFDKAILDGEQLSQVVECGCHTLYAWDHGVPLRFPERGGRAVRPRVAGCSSAGSSPSWKVCGRGPGGRGRASARGSSRSE